jgi:hypothetical protein
MQVVSPEAHIFEVRQSRRAAHGVPVVHAASWLQQLAWTQAWHCGRSLKTVAPQPGLPPVPVDALPPVPVPVCDDEDDDAPPVLPPLPPQAASAAASAEAATAPHAQVFMRLTSEKGEGGQPLGAARLPPA